jgi:hypothetical protein
VKETIIECKKGEISLDQCILEIKSLRMAYHTIFLDCIDIFFPSLFPLPKLTLKSLKETLTHWIPLFMLYKEKEDQLELILQLQDYYIQHEEYMKYFCHSLHHLYEKSVFEEEVIFEWEENIKEGIEDEEEEEMKKKLTSLLSSSSSFLSWLRDAEEDEEESD